MSIGDISLEAIPSLGGQRNLVLSRKELALVLEALHISQVKSAFSFTIFVSDRNN